MLAQGFHLYIVHRTFFREHSKVGLTHIDD